MQESSAAEGLHPDEAADIKPVDVPEAVLAASLSTMHKSAAGRTNNRGRNMKSLLPLVALIATSCTTAQTYHVTSGTG